MRKVLQSFASRLTFYILTLTTLIFLCIAVVFHRYSRLREERQAVDYTLLLQEKLIQKVDFQLEEVENTVRSEVYRVRHVRDNPSEMMPVVKSMVRSDTLIVGGGIAFVRGYYADKGELFMEYACMEGPEGQERLVTKHLGDSTYCYPRMHWFADAVAQRKGIWSEPYYDKGGGNRMMTTYAYPITDDEGKVFAVITADVSLEDLSLNMFSVRPYPDSYSFLVSRKGTYIAYDGNQQVVMRNSIFSRARQLDNADLAFYGRKMLAGEKGSFRSRINDKEVLACYAPLTRTGWSICSVSPYGTVMAQLGSTFGVVALILLGGLMLLSLCIRVLVKFTVKPIRQLTEATRQIANGNFDYPLPQVDTRDDLSVLHDAFEHMRQSLLEYISQLKTTTQLRERIESELTIAHDIQMDIVPKDFPSFSAYPNLELHALLKPAKEVGGDLYDFFFRDGKLFFCIGDVSGKGIPASLVMAITSTLFRMTANSFDDPATIVTKLNDTIADNNEANMFVTMFVGALDLKSGVLSYCNAGHNPPLLVSRDGSCEYLRVKANLPVGVMTGARYDSQTATLRDHQALLTYTDGFTEAENARQELFGEERALATTARYASYPVKDMVSNIQSDLLAFVNGAEQSDDLTLLCIRWKEATSTRELVIDNDLADSAKLAPFVESVGKELQLPAAMVMSTNLALEEALVNVIQYAYPKGTKGKIVLRAHWEGERPQSVTFELEDEGKPFDPTLMKEADVTLGVADRPIGGLGIYLTRKLMDNVSYQREENHNKLVMVKDIRSKG